MLSSIGSRAAADPEELHFRREARSRFVRTFLRYPAALPALILFVIVVLCALGAPLLTQYTPFEGNAAERLQGIGTAGHLLGTDEQGRDILTRCLYGARISLLVGICSVIVAGVIGTLLGLISGYYGGWADRIIMRIADAFHAIPRILLAMVVLFVMGPSVFTLIMVIGVTNWVSYARIIRSEVLSVKEKEYVKASRTIGTGNFAIIRKHILPNVFAQFIVVSTISVASSIIIEATMSFLGLGIQPPTVSWGVMLADGRNYLATQWWVCTFPGIAITLTVLGIMFLGNWLRDVLDPKNQGIR